MKSCLGLGYSCFRVIVGVISLGTALFFGGTAQAAPQYNMTCDDCHRMPPLDSATGQREPATGAFKGNHQTHATASVSTCAKCHGSGVVTYLTGHRDKTIQVQGNINNSPATGTYSRAFFNQTSVPPATLGTCSNVNCHFESVSDPWGVLPASTYTALGANGATCGKCHGAPPGDGSHPATSGSGKKHGDYYGTGTGSCVKCHPNHTAEGKPFAHATSAGSRSLDLQFTAAPNSGGAYSKSANLSYPNYLPSQTSAANRNGTCASLYCHSDGSGGAPNTVPTWGGALPADCSGCHGGNDSSSAILSSGKHSQHMSNASLLGDNFECVRCHSATVSVGNDRVITILANHVDGAKNVSFNNGGTFGAGTCSATLCHAAGKVSAPQPAAPTWSGAALDCKGCHGAGGNYGQPSYGNAGAALDLANSHNANHIAGAASCATCHNSTTADGVSIKPGAPHTNGAINVSFSAAYDLGGASYNGTIGTKSCSATYCHSNGNGAAPFQVAKWGDSMPANCTGCHGNDATAPAGKKMATGVHAAHMNNYTTLGSGNNFKCADCHARTVSTASNQAVTGPASHVNTLKDYSGARAGKNYVAATKVCSNVYCHSSGLLTDLTYRNMTGAKAWNGSAKLGCNGCHGYGPGAFNPVAGEPNYVNGGIGSGNENSHQAHVGHLGVTTTRGCAKCHRSTVDAGVANKLRDYSSSHLNKTVNISFQPLGNYTGHFSESDKSCSNTYCHAGSPAQWGGPSKNCYDCHKADATLGGNHYIHWQSTGVYPPAYVMTPGNIGDTGNYRWACSSCHQGEDANGPPSGGGGSAAEVFFGYTSANRHGTYTYGSNKTLDGTLTQSDGTCANTYCHSDGVGGGPINGAFNWYSNPGTIGCAGCHGGNAGSASPMATGKHGVHISNTPVLGVNFACADCHAGVVNTDSNVSDKRKHANKFKDYSGQKALKSFYTGPSANCAASYCHSNGKGSAGNAVTWSQGGSWATKCNQCHGTSNAAGSPDYASGPAGSATANNHGKHALTSAGNYGISCGECHSRTTKNGTAIRTSVVPTYHINMAVNDVFFNLSGASKNGAYAAGAMTCSDVYCHSNGQTAAAPFTTISTAKWGATLSCKGCHGYTTASGKQINTYVHGNHINNPTVVGKSVGCQDCHSATTANGTTIATIADHTNQSVNIKFDNSVNLNGDNPTYNGAVTTGADGYAKGVGNAGAQNSCANVYCHSTGTVNGATPTFRTVAWNASWSGSKCVNCHGDGSSRAHNTPDVTNNPGGGTANNHVKHVEAKGFSCDYCHVNTTTDTATLPTSVIDGGSHLNRTDDVNFKSYGAMTGTYTATVGTKSCASTYCHSNGGGGAPLKVAKWGDAMPANCTGCHGGDTTAPAASVINTYKHRAHMNNYTTLGRGNNLKCAECHARTVALASNQTVTAEANHVNAFKDYSGVRAGGSANYVAATKVCSNVYCHSSGQATPTFRNMTGSKAWGGTGSLGCNSCHGYGPGEFTSAYGAPNYVSSAGKENSHKKHVFDAGFTSTTGCVKCHRVTVDSTIASKLRDYSSAHLNKARNISFASLGNYTGHYTAATKSCDNTYCHAGSSATWGGAALACFNCHKADATLAGVHNKHWETSGVYATSYTATPGNVTGTTSNYRFDCSSCHKGQHANGTSAQGGANGAAAEIFFGYTSANRKGTYTFGGTSAYDGTLKYTNGTCAATYCHSNGNGANGYNTTFTWTGSGLGCADCHGDAKTAGKLLSTGYHQNHMNKGTSPTLGNTFGCVECHKKTVSGNTTLADKTKHINKFKDYSGVSAGRIAVAGSGNCANVYCHSSGQAIPTYRTPQNWYVAGTSYDCKGCHGADTSGPAGVFTTQFGEPNYTNYSSANRNYYNSHSAKHIAANADCALCHVNTVNASFALVSSASTPKHLDKQRQVDFDTTSAKVGNNSPAYNATAKTCANVKCHSNGQASPTYKTPRWGSAMPADCTGCHGGNATSASILNSGTHTPHMNEAAILGANYECARCHNTTVSTGNDRAITGVLHMNGASNVAFNNGGTYSTGTCSTTLCHAAGKSAAPQPTAPIWGGAALDCKGCHGAGSSYGEPSYSNAGSALDLANSHGVKHVANAASCANCHANTTTDGVSIKSGATIHTDGSINVNFGATYDLGGATYTPTIGTKSCSATYCHSNGNGGAPIQTAKWGDSMPANCAGCHGGDATVPAASVINTYKHRAHMNNYTTLGRGNNLKCAECHAKTVALASNQVVTSAANHVNVYKDYSGVKAGGGSNYVTATKVCSNVYCHSSGQATPVFRNMTGSKAWGGTGSLGCNSCHGYGPGTFTSAYGAPNYVSSAGKENSHKKHVFDAGITSTTGCVKCHRITVDSTVASKLRDYSSAHLNKARNVSFASLGNYTGHYTAASKSCDNTYCHAGATATWGGASLACNSCHKADATLPGRHSTHWAQTGAYPTSYTNYSGNVSAAGQYRFMCSSCHKAGHANGPVQPSGNAAEIFFNFTTPGRAGGYTYGGTTAMDGTLKWSNGTCATTYCHSDGNGGNPNNGTFNWNSSTGTLNCTGCHGDNVASGTPIATGKHGNHINPATGALLGTGNGIGCVACHAKTVTNDTTIGNKPNHVNKFKDYSGVMAGGSGRYNTTIAKSCNNIYCHSNGNPGAVVFVTMTGSKTWIGAATVGCNGCHGRSNPATGAPDYANGYPGNMNTANSHSKHISQFIAQGAPNNSTICARCHAKTVNAGVANKFRSYSTLHLNGTPDVSIQAAYGGAFGGNVCSSVLCHSDGKGLYRNPTWGETSDCSFCHPMNTLTGAHRFHVYTSVTNNTPAFYNNYTANRSNVGSATGRYNFGCSNCHPTSNAAHMTGTVVIDLKPVAAGGTLKSKNSASITQGAVVAGTANSGTFGASGSNVKCFGVYCHSNGGSAAGAVAFQAYTSPEWYTSAGKPSDPCSMCHGNWPNSPRAGDNKVMVGSPTHYNSNWLGTSQAGGHAMGIHADKIVNGSDFTALLAPGSTGNVSHGIAGQATTISCSTCHNTTVTTSANNGSAQCVGCHTQPATQANAAIANKAMHLNGSVNVVFQTTTVNSKAQLRDASFSLNSSATLWHRNNGYKSTVSPYSFDSSKQNLNVANPYVSATGCSSVICHFNQNVKWNNPAPAVTCNSCHLSTQM